MTMAMASTSSVLRACQMPHRRGAATLSGWSARTHSTGHPAHQRRGSLHVVAVAKPDMNARRVKELEAEGKPVEFDAEDVDLPNWITTKWEPVLGGGWWDATDLEKVDTPVPMEPEPEEPLTEWELEVKKHKAEQQAHAREKYAWEQAQEIDFEPLDNSMDPRLVCKHGEKMDWTHEEIVEFIGHWSYEPLTVYSSDWNYDYNAHLTPAVPDTHEWMEIKGLIRDDEDEELTDDGLLQEEFSDFDNSKVTMSDMSALDIGREEEESQGNSEGF